VTILFIAFLILRSNGPKLLHAKRYVSTFVQQIITTCDDAIMKVKMYFIFNKVKISWRRQPRSTLLCCTQPLRKLARPQDFWFFRERKHSREFETGLSEARTGERESESIHASLDEYGRSIDCLLEGGRGRNEGRQERGITQGDFLVGNRVAFNLQVHGRRIVYEEWYSFKIERKILSGFYVFLN